VGLDASRGLLSFAAAKVGTGSLAQGDAVMLPFRSGSFDAIHSIAAIHHMPSEDERRQLLLECRRVLRKGGVLIVSAWAVEQRRFRLIRDSTDVHVPWWKPDGTAYWRFYHLFREGELPQLVADVGFAIERAWREGDNHVVLAGR